MATNITTKELLALTAERQVLLETIAAAPASHAVTAYLNTEFSDWNSDRFVNWSAIQNPIAPKNKTEAVLKALAPVGRAFKQAAIIFGSFGAGVALGAAVGGVAVGGVVGLPLAGINALLGGSAPLDLLTGSAEVGALICAIPGVYAGKDIALKYSGEYGSAQPSARAAYEEILYPAIKSMGADPKIPVPNLLKDASIYDAAKPFVIGKLEGLELEDLRAIHAEIGAIDTAEKERRLASAVESRTTQLDKRLNTSGKVTLEA